MDIFVDNARRVVLDALTAKLCDAHDSQYEYFVLVDVFQIGLDIGTM